MIGGAFTDLAPQLLQHPFTNHGQVLRHAAHLAGIDPRDLMNAPAPSPLQSAPDKSPKVMMGWNPFSTYRDQTRWLIESFLSKSLHFAFPIHEVPYHQARKVRRMLRIYRANKISSSRWQRRFSIAVYRELGRWPYRPQDWACETNMRYTPEEIAKHYVEGITR